VFCDVVVLMRSIQTSAMSAFPVVTTFLVACLPSISPAEVAGYYTVCDPHGRCAWYSVSTDYSGKFWRTGDSGHAHVTGQWRAASSECISFTPDAAPESAHLFADDEDYQNHVAGRSRLGEGWLLCIRDGTPIILSTWDGSAYDLHRAKHPIPFPGDSLEHESRDR
jgi:hypothetical protein